MNSFGRHFRVTTFGESHGPAIGVVVDGVPPRLPLDVAAIQTELDRRRPGQSALASGRREDDAVEILSGVYMGVTTGAPIAMLIANRDARPDDYRELASVFRPGHADFTWQAKYGVRDPRGGGRASGRETAVRVAAGAVARQLLLRRGVRVLGHVVEIGGIRAERFDEASLGSSPVRAADPEASVAMVHAIEAAQRDGDSLGGVVAVHARGVPAGWGDPVFGKLDAALAGALMGIGAVKAVEIGDGFALARLRGSEANDAPGPDGFASNHAGGIQGGISNGSEIVARVAVKPTPSIARPQATLDLAGAATTVSVRGRHDPCIAPRLVPVAEAMVCLVLVDAWLAQLLVEGGAAG
ncbi:MAG: chorismate synthase [Myxococcales bacterium]|nr:chorismate synthase [Myxococcales bacterium]